MGEEEGFGGWQQWLRKGNQEFGFIHGMFEVPVRSSVMTSSSSRKEFKSWIRAEDIN